MRRLLFTALLTVAALVADAPSDRRAGVDPVKLIPLDASAYVQVRVKRFFETPVAKMFAVKLPGEVAKMNGELNKWYGLTLKDIESMTYIWPKLDQAGPFEPPVVIVVTREPYDRARIAKAIAGNVVTKDEKKPDTAGLPERDFVSGRNWSVYFLGSDAFIAGGNAKAIAALVELMKRKSKRGVLEPALRVALPEHSLIAGAGGENGLPWTWPKPIVQLQPLGAATSLGFGILVNEDVRLRVFADFPPGMAADGRDAATQLPVLARVLSGAPPEMSYLRFFAPLFQNVATEVDGTMLRIGAGVPPPVIAAMLDNMAYGPRRAEEQKQMKAIAAAMQKYHDEHEQKFPAHAIYSKDGKPLLSWRVELLPTLGQKALYEKFHRDEPWDSEHNKTLIGQIPPVYLNVTASNPRDKGLTHFQLFVGERAAWPKSRESFGMKKITDGTSNTVMLVQSAEPIVWTKPDDLEYDPEKPLPKFGINGKPPMIVLFDGSGRDLPPNWPEKNWRTIITPASGEAVDWPK